jgi:peptidoglycan/LPS O-acetylase OafA/YrhL
MLRHRGTEAGEVAAKFGVAIMFLAAIIAWHVPSWDLIGWPVSQFGMVLLVAAATGATALASGLSTRPLVWLGRRSYSLYLWHMPALWLTAAALGHWGSRVAAVPLALCFAAASYRYVEQPFRRRRVAPVIERVEPVIDPVAGSAA